MVRHPKTRLTLLVLLGIAVGFASLFLVPLADGSQSPPADPTGSASKAFLASAQKQRAKVIFPRDFSAAETSLSRARLEMNLQLSALWGTRDFRPALRLMDGAQSEAFNLFLDAALHQRETRELAQRAIESAVDSVAASRKVSRMSPGTYANAKLAAAEQKLFEARSCMSDGRFDEALTAAQRAAKESELAHRHSRLILARFDDPGNLAKWQGWISQATAASRRSGGPAFVVIKERHRLDVYKAGRRVRSVPVDLGANYVNQKMHAGDRATPEGLYRVTQKKGNGSTKYYLALLLDYPNTEDRSRFADLKKRGAITRRTAIGGLIEIHGDGGRGYDWTDGCVAPSSEDMKLLYNEAVVGMSVAIVGSDGTEGPVRSLLREKKGDKVL